MRRPRTARQHLSMSLPTAPGPRYISSWNGLAAAQRTVGLLRDGLDLLDALVEGVRLVEDDPNEHSVGLGGLPNEDGVVELDAAIMDARTHRCCGVAGVRGVRHVAALALDVMRRTDHSLLVGEGALKFARSLGYPEESLLTDASRKAWLDWKATLSPRDGWLSPDELAGSASGFGQARWAGSTDPNANSALPAAPGPNDSATPAKAPHTYGTIHASALDGRGGLACVTSTSGLSYKLAGRVGDSPIPGAGLYADQAVGSAGATGRGEASMQTCAAYAVVERMAAGDTPEQACLAVLRRIADRTIERRLLDPHGRPAFNVTLYALRKDGLTGAASMHEGYEHVVHDGVSARLRPCAWLFPKKP